MRSTAFAVSPALPRNSAAHRELRSSFDFDIGLAPLAIGLNQPGQEIEGPMAITVLGGLVSSTLLNLIVLPVLVYRFGGPTAAAAALPA